jgi:enoyl-CoA hydratase/carnithine racemase
VQPESEAEREIATGTDEVRCAVTRRVARVVLHRPEARNALTLAMKRALVELLPALADEAGVGCVLLTGAGDAFCAGGDTRKMADDGRPPDPAARMAQLRWEHRIPAALHRMPKPTLAALPGPAAGAGFALALACDLRVMSARAFVTTAYARLGLSGDYGASWFLTRLVGPARAREILFLGERLDAEACARLGLANRVVPHDALEEEAFALAARLAAGPPRALASMKEALNRALDEGLDPILDLEAQRMVESATTEDYEEAVRALREKRDPVFRGR